jgi:hypothetical protein
MSEERNKPNGKLDLEEKLGFGCFERIHDVIGQESSKCPPSPQMVFLLTQKNLILQFNPIFRNS